MNNKYKKNNSILKNIIIFALLIIQFGLKAESFFFKSQQKREVPSFTGLNYKSPAGVGIFDLDMLVSKMAFLKTPKGLLNKKFVSELTYASSYRVHVKCDECPCIYSVCWSAREDRIKKNKKDLCPSCARSGFRNSAYGRDRRGVGKGIKKTITKRPPCKPETAEKIRKANTGKKQSRETIEKRNKTMETKNGMKGKHHSREYKKRARIRELKRVLLLRSLSPKKCGTWFNPYACEVFNLINKHFNFNGDHAMNRGEYAIKDLGYVVDYYEPSLNLVIEYYEKHHFQKENIKKDKIRQDEITEFLQCRFIVITYKETIEEILYKIKNELSI